MGWRRACRLHTLTLSSARATRRPHVPSCERRRVSCTPHPAARPARPAQHAAAPRPSGAAYHARGRLSRFARDRAAPDATERVEGRAASDGRAGEGDAEEGVEEGVGGGAWADVFNAWA
eukprot:4993077-Prymnesium_polylepis.1